MNTVSIAIQEASWDVSSASPQAKLVRGIYRDAWLEGAEAQKVLPISYLYYVMKALKEEEISALLGLYFGGAADAVKRLDVDPRKLASLMLWLMDTLRLKISGADIVEDPETGEPQFIEVYVEDCGWDEWKILSRTVKEHLVGEGFDDIAGRVALVCRKALRRG